MRKIASFLFVVLSFALGLEFTVTITAHSGTTTAQGVIGIRAGANNGLGMEDIPYFGFPPSFALYFQNPDLPTPLQFTTDIRSNVDTLQRWDGYIANSSSPFVNFSWTPVSLATDSGTLFVGHCAIGGTPDSMFDMTATTSLTIPTGDMLKIVFRKFAEPVDDSFPPFVIWWNPEDGDTIESLTHPLAVLVADSGGAGIDTASVGMILNGINISWFLNKTITSEGLLISYNPTVISYTLGSNVVMLSVSDNVGNRLSDTIQFFFVLPDTGDTTPDTTGFVISGRVLLSGSFSLSGTKVKVIEVACEETTDFMGGFEFDPLPSDTYTVLAARDGYIPQQVVIYLTRDTTLFFMLESSGGTGVTIRGYVFLQGQSNHQGTNIIGTAIMGEETVSTMTNSAGFFMLNFSVPGMFKILASRTGYYSDSVFVFAVTDTTIQSMTLVPMGFVFEETPNRSSINVLPAIGGLLIRSENVSSIKIFDIYGRVILEWENPATEVFWDWTIMGKKLPSGAYFLVAGTKQSTRKTIFIVR